MDAGSSGGQEHANLELTHSLKNASVGRLGEPSRSGEEVWPIRTAIWERATADPA
jgi:hypothetical protein